MVIEGQITEGLIGPPPPPDTQEWPQYGWQTRMDQHDVFKPKLGPIWSISAQIVFANAKV